MIRAIVKLGQWLDSRFPAKVIVTADSFLELQRKQVDFASSVVRLHNYVDSLVEKMNTLENRMRVVESNAVHKGAVQDLVTITTQLKDDYTSFKASMGFVAKEARPELTAMLNGEYLPGEQSNV